MEIFLFINVKMPTLVGILTFMSWKNSIEIEVGHLIRPRGYNKNFMLNSAEIFLLINIKQPTLVGILTFMSWKNSIISDLSLQEAEYLDIFILMSI